MIGFLSILFAIIIYLPDEAALFQLCPERGSTYLPSISYHPDEKFCNIYHKCNCTTISCHVVESQVCPMAKVYSKSIQACIGLSSLFNSCFLYLYKYIFISIDIEEESCGTTYVQWVHTYSSNSLHSNDKVAVMISNSLRPSMSTNDFECDEDAPGKYRFES